MNDQNNKNRNIYFLIMTCSYKSAHFAHSRAKYIQPAYNRSAITQIARPGGGGGGGAFMNLKSRQQKLKFFNIFFNIWTRRKWYYTKLYISWADQGTRYRDVTRTLIGGGGEVFIHVFMFCPTDFFWIWVDFKRNPSGVTRIYE